MPNENMKFYIHIKTTAKSEQSVQCEGKMQL